MARRIDAELYAVFVEAKQDSSADNQKTLEANIQFAESLGATVARLKGDNIPDSVAAFTRDKHITQVIFGRSAVTGWRKWLYMSAMNRFLQGAPAVDVHIVTQEPD
jgi:two-component system sensor histidine kinase KdpD